ncbi:MAG: DUF4381 family protein [Verrucomicrobiae bacterium]|nr:DUF4381 family protein [Verrucomicrobiae bacterium]
MNPTDGTAPLPDIRDIAGPETLPSLWEVLALIGGISLGLVLLGGLIFFLYRTLTKKHQMVASPLTIAKRRLDALEGQALTLTPNAFSLAVSETLKDYVAARFGDSVRYETTEEFLYRLSQAKANALPNSVREKVATFLSVSDEIKYGKTADAETRKLPLLELARDVLTVEPEPAPARSGPPPLPKTAGGSKKRRPIVS